jgi:hypothetical protein
MEPAVTSDYTSLLDLRSIDKDGKDVIEDRSRVRRPALTGIQHSVNIAVDCFLDSCVLGFANVLKKENSLKEANQGNMETEPHETGVPLFGSCDRAAGMFSGCLLKNGGLERCQ